MSEVILETLGQHFVHTAEKMGSTSVSMRKKDFGIWNEYSWRQCYQHIKNFAMGLAALGLEKGEVVGIIGDNDPEWYWAEVATLCIGGIAVGIFPDSIISEIAYIINHSEAKIIIARDQEQVDKILELRKDVPTVEKAIYWDNKGMWSYRDNPFLMSLEQLEDLGKKYEKDRLGIFEENLKNGKKSDIALCLYTSGTTGEPKGVLIDHAYLIGAIKRWLDDELKREKSVVEYVSFLSPAWIADQLLGISTWCVYGFIINFPEEPETLLENIREVGSSILVYSPRQWENLISMVQVNMEDANFTKKIFFKLSLAIGYKISDFYFAKKGIPFGYRILYALAKWTTLNPLKDKLGFSNIRLAYTAGSLLGPDVFKFYYAIGIRLREVYGMTEATPITTHKEYTKLGTVGRTLDGTGVKIADNGEILITSKNIFRGYYKNPEATKETVTGDNWVKTGDAGIIDEEGYLVVMDRVKDMMKLSDGSTYSPSFIENLLKFSIYVKDAMISAGTDGSYVFGIIIIDFENVGKWAEKQKISYTTHIDLSQKPNVYELVTPIIQRANKYLPEGAQVKKFSILHKEFDPDEGDLTRSRKLRRFNLEKRYEKLISAAYDNKSKVTLEDQVLYRDGRTSKTIVTISIKEIV